VAYLRFDRELLLPRLVIADRRKPDRCAAAPSSRVHHQVGVEGLLDIGGVAQDPYSDDAVAGEIGGQTDDLAPVEQLDSWQRTDPTACMPCQTRPAGLADERVGGSAQQPEQVTRGENRSSAKSRITGTPAADSSRICVPAVTSRWACRPCGTLRRCPAASASRSRSTIVARSYASAGHMLRIAWGEPGLSRAKPARAAARSWHGGCADRIV
jgi:hypothetical protein